MPAKNKHIVNVARRPSLEGMNEYEMIKHKGPDFLPTGPYKCTV